MTSMRTGESGIGNRESGIGNRESGIGNRESGIGNRKSEIGNRKWVKQKQRRGTALIRNPDPSRPRSDWPRSPRI
ncbi:hypothetical protein BRN91_12380 [Xanthomonas oryzae pv. oryzae]|nr:hypothetical protein BRN91_12380 [Xanthomonas oryzae pv. oryzae]